MNHKIWVMDLVIALGFVSLSIMAWLNLDALSTLLKML